MKKRTQLAIVKPSTIAELQQRLGVLSEMQKRLGPRVLDDDFFRDHARNLRELAETADPFIKKRLLQLAQKYEQRLGQPARLPPDLRGLESKMTPER